MNYNAQEFQFSSSRKFASEDVGTSRVSKKVYHSYNIIKASFLGVDCSSLTMLSYIKSWLKAYLYNKIGSLKSETTAYSNLHFAKKTKNGEHFLHAYVKGKDGKEIYLDYQEVTMLEIAVSKALGLLT